MRRLLGLALWLVGVPLSSQQGPALRARVEAALERTALQGSLPAETLVPLATAALEEARSASSRSARWTALSLLAELLQVAPADAARPLRVEALTLLTRHEPDSLRGSALLSQRFLPPFARLPRATWARELAAYDADLDALFATADSDRTRAEILHTRAFARVFLERRWDWLGAAGRRAALELLAELEQRFGALPVPGTSQPERETVGRRSRQLADELTRLHFGAAAPATAGVDLDGQPLDLDDLSGRVVVLDFWTSFCQPCLALVPGTRTLLETFADQPLAYVGVCGDPDAAQGRTTARHVGMSWPNLWDGPLGTDGPAATAWCVGAQGWPSIFVLDREGRIRHKLFGKEEIETKLEPALRALLAEREH